MEVVRREFRVFERDAIYEVPDRPTPAFGLRPISHVDRLRSWRAFRSCPTPLRRRGTRDADVVVSQVPVG